MKLWREVLLGTYLMGLDTFLFDGARIKEDDMDDGLEVSETVVIVE